MALGALQRNVLTRVLRQGLCPILTGIVLGMAIAFALMRGISSLLYGLSPTDPLTFAAVPLLMTSAALVACYVPARRATQVNPMTALHYE
jgi:putative ABC transport system permease protein